MTKTVEERLRGMEVGFRARYLDSEANTVVEAADLIKEMREALRQARCCDVDPQTIALIDAALKRAEARNG